MEEIKCAVGKVQEAEEDARQGPKLTYAAVLKDPAFLAKQLQERQKKAHQDQAEQEIKNRKKEDNIKREEENRDRRNAKKEEETQRRQRATEKLEEQNERERKAFQCRQELCQEARTQ